MSRADSAPTVDTVLSSIRDELRAPTRYATTTQDRVERLKEMQRRFRTEPIGGRLLALKKLFYWFTASAFDRQAKVIEGMLNVLEDLDSPASSRLIDDSPGRRRTTVPPLRQDIFAGGNHDRGTGRLEHALAAKAEMQLPEKLLLYGLVFGSKPERVLEIGTFRGGSTEIICAALDDNALGHVTCVDPNPRVPDAVLERIQHRATILAGPSPEILDEASRRAGGRFDFALIDGDHGYEGVLRDIEGALPLLEPGALVVFHDSHYWEVADAIGAALARFPDRLSDGGELSALRNPQAEPGLHGRPAVWGGLRLLRFLGTPL